MSLFNGLAGWIRECIVVSVLEIDRMGNRKKWIDSAKEHLNERNVNLLE